jgi:hypothetical protein
MSIAACAENTMKIIEVKTNDDNYDNSDNKCADNKCADNKCDSGNNSNFKYDNDDTIFFKNALNDSDDDMVVIILEEDIKMYKNEQNEQNREKMFGKTSEENSEETGETGEDEKESKTASEYEKENENVGDVGDDGNIRINIDSQQQQQQSQEKNVNALPKQKYIGVEVYTHLQQTLEAQKMYPLLPCNMISSFARVMEYVEYFDIPSEERKKLVVDLVKILAYSNNDYGSRDCFEYFVEHNMIDDIIKTIVDSTKNRYDINRFPHTNRKIVLSCVSLSNKIKIAKPNVKMDSLFEEFKLNLCGLKRFFKMKEKEESKQT